MLALGVDIVVLVSGVLVVGADIIVLVSRILVLGADIIALVSGRMSAVVIRRRRGA